MLFTNSCQNNNIVTLFLSTSQSISFSKVKKQQGNNNKDNCTSAANGGSNNGYSSLVTRGKGHKQAKEYEKALDCFEQALKIRQDNGQLWFDKGHTLLLLQNYEEAITCIDNGIEIEPEN